MMATMSIIRSSISFVQMTKNCGGGSALFGPLCTGQQCNNGAAAVAAVRGGTGWCGGSSLTPAPQVIPNDNIPMDLICPSHTWDKTSNFFPLTFFWLIALLFWWSVKVKVNQLFAVLQTKWYFIISEQIIDSSYVMNWVWLFNVIKVCNLYRLFWATKTLVLILLSFWDSIFVRNLLVF